MRSLSFKVSGRSALYVGPAPLLMGTVLVAIPLVVRSSKKYSSATSPGEAKSEKRASRVARSPARRTRPAAPGHVEHASTMGSTVPADALARPGVAPSIGELSQLAGQADDPGGPS